ncbi:hypothetical protein [Pontibacter fetidus]|uniref:Uncharacterized protein n=1 Tax=Pontibacter fetidus TaxID=2700082 RepID=A0A6B2H686_9BACT|nr:hypothetical protein [Pontibacter fetidus]NDK56286.1 hypothetical protein [Pontibacter fetidus]
MHKLILLFLLHLTATYTFAQETEKTDLYQKVAVIMKTDLGYSYDFAKQ